MKGFFLTRLTLSGRGVQDAELELTLGLNVITGPSDTGKTFIAQCINFMLGGSKTPKEIPEARGYESLSLGLRGHGLDDDLILERSIQGGDFRLRAGDRGEVVLGGKHQGGSEDTVSHFLLDLTGLAGRKVRVNQQGKTRPLSFRDLSRLILVDEETVISERSPLFSGQHTLRTVEGSVFRLLLSGTDDSAVIGTADPKITKGRREGRSEIIEALLDRTREEINGLKLRGDEPDLREQLAGLDALVEKASSRLSEEQATAVSLEDRRRNAWTELRQTESRINVLAELQRRFELLQEQYASDLRRLEAIAEAGVRLGQMQEERCPVCGAAAQFHDREHQERQARPADVASACSVEAEKIRRLIVDLQSTRAANQSELDRLSNGALARRAELDSAGEDLRERLQPRIQAAIQELSDSHSQRDLYRHALDLYARVSELERLRIDGEELVRPAPLHSRGAAVPASDTEDFSKEVESLLRAWHFPSLDRVTFSDEDRDVVISGRRRASHGKGLRAITHAAFTIALLKHCRERSMPHPGLVVIDSPLVVYREPDQDERGVSRDLKDAFYRSLASVLQDAQVIILENEDPPRDVDAAANVITFTGTTKGRWGYIPTRGPTTGEGRRER